MFRLTATVALALLGIVAALNPASGEVSLAKCQPGRPDTTGIWLDGWYRDPNGTPTGVYSNIKNYSPWVYPNRFSAAWVMLERPAIDAWAQIGWIEKANNWRRTFVQVFNWQAGQNYTRYEPARPVDTYTYYTVYFYQYLGIFRFVYGGTDWPDQVPATFVPTRGSIFGEIDSLASQMPGGYQIWLPGGVQRFPPRG